MNRSAPAMVRRTVCVAANVPPGGSKRTRPGANVSVELSDAVLELDAVSLVSGLELGAVSWLRAVSLVRGADVDSDVSAEGPMLVVGATLGVLVEAVDVGVAADECSCPEADVDNPPS